jgi:hypothetical protein
MSIDTDRADLSRREHLAPTAFQLRTEIGALRSRREEPHDPPRPIDAGGETSGGAAWNARLDRGTIFSRSAGPGPALRLLHHVKTDDGIMAGASGIGRILVDFQPMSPEELQRMMQFLLNQQAQFDANLEKLSAKTDRIAEGLIGLTGLVGRAIGDLAAAQQRTDDQLRETDGHLNEVASHLNLVIGMFERHLREDHGQQPS